MVRSVEITSIHRMTPKVKQFELEADEPFSYEPGQHTRLHVDPADLSPEARADGEGEVDDGDGDDGDGDQEGEGDDGDDGQEGEDEEVVRPYTPTSLPGTERITLAIKRYDGGTASVYMHERERGDTIRIEDPDGDLYVRDFDRDAVFVASGTGVTPMIVMVRQYVAEGSGDAYFLFGEKTRADLMYRETLDQLEAENLTVVYSLSDEEWDGPTGHVQAHVPEYVEDLDSAHFYACGVPGMVVETEDLLEERGVDEDRIFTEGWEGDAVDDESEDGSGE